jgi:uncharacterized membrane protein YfcA
VSEVAAALIGVVAGAVGGLLGVGGGILFVPALVILLDQSQLGAEATSLLAIIPVAVVGTWRQHRYGNVRMRHALLIGLLSPVGVVAGTVIANSLPERALEVGFSLLMLLVALQLVRRARTAAAPAGSELEPADPQPRGSQLR